MDIKFRYPTVAELSKHLHDFPYLAEWRLLFRRRKCRIVGRVSSINPETCEMTYEMYVDDDNETTVIVPYTPNATEWDERYHNVRMYKAADCLVSRYFRKRAERLKYIQNAKLAYHKSLARFVFKNQKRFIKHTKDRESYETILRLIQGSCMQRFKQYTEGEVNAYKDPKVSKAWDRYSELEVHAFSRLMEEYHGFLMYEPRRNAQLREDIENDLHYETEDITE